MEEHPLDQSAPKRAYEDTKSFCHNSLVFFIGVQVVVMGGFIYLATIMTPDNASKLVSASYPAIGTVVGALVGLGIIWLVMLYLVTLPRFIGRPRLEFSHNYQ